jgi:hypothetical protein
VDYGLNIADLGVTVFLITIGSRGGAPFFFRDVITVTSFICAVFYIMRRWSELEYRLIPCVRSYYGKGS